MHIVLFTHPSFMNSQSMPKFAAMLVGAYKKLGHSVEIWTPKPIFYRLFSKSRFSKWAGYVDQFLLFPIWVRFALRNVSDDALFVFSDQALGPWVPLVHKRPHVVHAHDLLALRSALGLIPENPTSWSGKLYQRYIRSGFQKTKHFISVSNTTKQDLVKYGRVHPFTSEVVYNGLNYPFKPVPFEDARLCLAAAGMNIPDQGILLHISGNQWYKNVIGVIQMYAEYVKTNINPLPLWLVGVRRTDVIDKAIRSIPPTGQVEFFYSLTGEQIEAAYSAARIFLFPSHAEGFGWPIVEAQACGCAVITTNEGPMNEIGGPHASYIPRLTAASDLSEWGKLGSALISEVLTTDSQNVKAQKAARVEWASKFTADASISAYLRIYEHVLSLKNSQFNQNII